MNMLKMPMYTPIFAGCTEQASSAYGIERMLAQLMPTSANEPISHAGEGTTAIDRKPRPPSISEPKCTARRLSGRRAA